MSVYLIIQVFNIIAEVIIMRCSLSQEFSAIRLLHFICSAFSLFYLFYSIEPFVILFCHQRMVVAGTTTGTEEVVVAEGEATGAMVVCTVSVICAL